MNASYSPVELRARYLHLSLSSSWVAWSEVRLFGPLLAPGLLLLSPLLASSAVVLCAVLTLEHFPHLNEKPQELLQVMAVVSSMVR